jgi:D-serine deaminase-like pyridoxal phosphate-dependent protein
VTDLRAATASLDPPFAVVDLEAFDANAADLVRRAGSKPVRLASKSVRVRALISRALDSGLQGILAFTLPEALWLVSHGFGDIVVAYPTVDRAALRELAEGPARERITLMVDCVEHLDLLSEGMRVCIDVDAGWWPLGGRVRIGAKRSPVRTPQAAAALAREARARARARRADELRGAHRRRRRPAAGAAGRRGGRGDRRDAARLRA